MARNPIPGRLNRESNPIPGTMAGFNPQFFDKDGHAIDVDENNPYPVGNYVKQGSLWVPVSSDNPMPTKDNEIKQKIEDLNQKLDGIIDGSTPANTQVTGSIAEEFIVNAQAITDVNVYTRSFSVPRSDWDIFISNTLDVPVWVGFYAGVSGNLRIIQLPRTDGTYNRYDAYARGRSYHVVPSEHSGLLSSFKLNDENVELNYPPYKGLYGESLTISYRADTVPATGSLTVIKIKKV